MQTKQNLLHGFILKLSDQFHAEQDRWFLTLPIFLSIGISIYPQHQSVIGWVPLIAFLLIFLAASWRCRVLARQAYPFFIAITVIIAGMCLIKLRTEMITAPVLQKEIGPVSTTGVVDEIEYLPKGVRVLLTDVSIDDLESSDTPRKIRLKAWSYDDKLRVGDRVEALAKLAPPSGPVIPGGYDFSRDLFYKQIGALGYSLKPLTIVKTASAQKNIMNDWRAIISQKIKSVQSQAAAGISIALIVGEQAGIPKPVVNDMRNVGLAHLLSISGLHLALVTGVVFFSVRLVFSSISVIALRFDIKKWAAALSICVGLFYMMLAGSPIPTQRSFIMVSIVFLAMLVDRRAISLRTVAIAALVILVLHPESLFNVGFQLSFSAVTLLIAGFEYMTKKEWIRNSDSWIGRGVSYFLGIILTTTLAEIATTFIALYHFNQFNTYGQLGNLVAIPLTGFWIMPWAILSLMLMPIGLEAFPLVMMEKGVNLLINTSHEIASWSHATLLYPRFSLVAIIFIIVGGLWWCIWQKPWRHAGIAVFLLGVILIFLTPVRPDVVVDNEGKLFAIYDKQQGLFLSSLKHNRFSAEKWLLAYGEKQKKALPQLQESENVVCDGEGCIVKDKNKSLAIVSTAQALREECGQHALILNLSRNREVCRTGSIMNFPRKNAVALNLEDIN